VRNHGTFARHVHGDRNLAGGVPHTVKLSSSTRVGPAEHERGHSCTCLLRCRRRPGLRYEDVLTVGMGSILNKGVNASSWSDAGVLRPAPARDMCRMSSFMSADATRSELDNLTVCGTPPAEVAVACERGGQRSRDCRTIDPRSSPEVSGQFGGRPKDMSPNSHLRRRPTVTWVEVAPTACTRPAPSISRCVVGKARSERRSRRRPPVDRVLSSACALVPRAPRHRRHAASPWRCPTHDVPPVAGARIFGSEKRSRPVCRHIRLQKHRSRCRGPPELKEAASLKPAVRHIRRCHRGA